MNVNFPHWMSIQASVHVWMIYHCHWMVTGMMLSSWWKVFYHCRLSAWSIPSLSLRLRVIRRYGRASVKWQRILPLSKQRYRSGMSKWMPYPISYFIKTAIRLLQIAATISIIKWNWLHIYERWFCHMMAGALWYILIAVMVCFLVAILCITASLLLVNFWISCCRKKGDMQSANVGYDILPVITVVDFIMILCLIGGSILFQFI